MIVRIDSMKCGLEMVESYSTCIAIKDRRTSVIFFADTSINRGHRSTKATREQRAISPFVSIVIHSGISTREKTKISPNVANGGCVLKINGDVTLDNVLTNSGHTIVDGTAEMLQTSTIR